MSGPVLGQVSEQLRRLRDVLVVGPVVVNLAEVAVVLGLVAVLRRRPGAIAPGAWPQRLGTA
jgi:hypothetical protein